MYEDTHLAKERVNDAKLDNIQANIYLKENET